MVEHITGRITGLKDEIGGLTARAAQIEARRDLLKHELDKGSAVILQNAFRNKRARDETGRRITNMENWHGVKRHFHTAEFFPRLRFNKASCLSV